MGFLWSAAARRSFPTPLGFTPNESNPKPSFSSDGLLDRVAWESCVEPQHSKEKFRRVVVLAARLRLMARPPSAEQKRIWAEAGKAARARQVRQSIIQDKEQEFMSFIRRIRLLKPLAIVLMVHGLWLSLVSPRVPAGRAAELPAYETVFRMGPLNVVTGEPIGVFLGRDWPMQRHGGVSFARPFRVGNQKFVFYLWKHSGDALIQQFNADGQLGAETDARNLEPGWTSVDFIYGVNTYVALHNAFTGQVRTYRIGADGRLAADPTVSLTHVKLQDTELFSPFLHNGQWRYFALDTWTGRAVTSGANWASMTESQWTRGWTSLDHLTHLGTAYRLIYKAEGDPQSSESSEAGRLVIQRLNSEGGVAQEIFDGNAGAHWSSVIFVPSAGSLLSPHKIFFYRKDTKQYEVRAFDVAAGLGPVLGNAQGELFNTYTDLKAVSMDGRTWLTALNDESAKPFTAAQARTMGLTIHNELQNKAVGYQFLLMQSGRVIYSRAHGLTQVSPVQTPMTTRTRLDLGSVGKMITTMTTLKQAEQGLVYLNQPIAGQLDENKYNLAALNPWVSQRTVLDLMKQTTGLAGGPGCVGDDATYQVTCQPFFTAAPTLTCVDGLCPRDYNNAHFGALRQVIENAANTQTTAELVQYTHDLWAKKIDLGGATGIKCSANPNSYSFRRCAGGDNCGNYNGVWWRQEEVDVPYSSSCGAGGWHASARQMGEFMAAARYSKVLGDNLNDLFMSTEHTALQDGVPVAGATALGWEPAWQAETGGEKLLHKNGARIGVAYITQLPNRMDAVVIANTALESHPQGLLNAAYKYSAGITTTPPVYIEVVSEGSATAGEISEVAANRISTSGIGQYATAGRDGEGNLRVISWNGKANGELEKKVTLVAGAASEIAITDGDGFVTALRNGSGNLQVVAWSAAFGNAANLQREGTGLGVPVSKVAATRLAGFGSTDGRVAIAVRNGDGNLRVSVWEFHNNGNQVVEIDSITAGAISDVAIQGLDTSGVMNQATRFVTAVRNASGLLQVDVWDVDSTGHLTRRGKATADAVSADSLKGKIAIGRFDDDDFFTAAIGSDGKLDVIHWTVNAAGNLTKGDQVEAGSVKGIATSNTKTVLRQSDDKFKLINWRLVNGQLERYGETSSGEISQVAAAGNVLCAMRLMDGTLRLNKWAFVD
jgi:CubicO group peptidase (beta-lactamase class C family)